MTLVVLTLLTYSFDRAIVGQVDAGAKSLQSLPSLQSRHRGGSGERLHVTVRLRCLVERAPASTAVSMQALLRANGPQPGFDFGLSRWSPSMVEEGDRRTLEASTGHQ